MGSRHAPKAPPVGKTDPYYVERDGRTIMRRTMMRKTADGFQSFQPGFTVCVVEEPRIAAHLAAALNTYDPIAAVHG